MIRSTIGIIGSYRRISSSTGSSGGGGSQPSGPAYYFSISGGDDSRTAIQAQNISTPWKSISKLNTVMSSLSSSYSVAFKRGETFTGSITLAKSGLTFEAYDTGSDPVISGFVDLTWTSIGGNKWESQVLSGRPETVLISGVFTLPSRFPKTGYFTFENSSGTNSITDNQISGSWSGADIVVRKNHTTWDKGIVTQSGTTLTFAPADANPFASNGWGYFLQNHIDACTANGDWVYTPSTGKITLYSTSSPTNCKASAVSRLIQGDGYSFNVKSLNIIGSNDFAISIKNASTGSITNCTLANNGSVGIFANNTPGVVISGNSLTNTNNVGIIIQGCVTASVLGNDLYTTGILGQGSATEVTNRLDYFAVALWDTSTSASCKYNRIYDTGFNAINFYYTNGLTIQNNFIQRFNLYKGDGAGIYTYVAGAGTYSGISVKDNIVLDGGGEDAGRSDTAYQSVYGIYMDDDTDNVTISGNTVANNPASGIFIHSSQNININDNTSYNNGNSDIDPSSASQIQLLSNTYDITGLIVSGNLFMSKETYQYCFQADYDTNTIVSSMPTLNSNRYFQPMATSSFITRTYISGDPSAVTHTFSAWKTYTGKDTVSSASFMGITNNDRIKFDYNATTASAIVSLGTSSYHTIYNTIISESLTLGPYSSSLLIRSGS